MQREFTLKTRDKKDIHCIHDTAGKKLSKTIVLFIHGLTGHSNEHTFYTAAQEFPKKGFDVFRFALYWGEENNRRLSECTISTHAEDLNTVISYLRPKYKKIIVVGHSLGSPTILKSDTSKVDAIILWDPSYTIDIEESVGQATVKNKKYAVWQWGTEFLLNPKMIKEWEWFNLTNELPLIQNLKKPLKIIAAGNGVLVEGGQKYFEIANEPKAFKIIKGAGHTFDEPETEKALLEETLSWIKKYG